MNATVERIRQLEDVPEDCDLVGYEAADLMQLAEESSIVEALALAYKLGFANGRKSESSRK